MNDLIARYIERIWALAIDCWSDNVVIDYEEVIHYQSSFERDLKQSLKKILEELREEVRDAQTAP